MGAPSSFWKPGLLVVLGLAVAGGAYALGRHARPAEGGPALPAQPAARAPVPVRTVRLVLRDVQDFMEFPGTAQSKKVVQISSEVLARIEKLPFRAGAKVKKGEMLVTLDDKVVQTQVRQADEAVGAAEARVRQAQAGVTGAEASRVEAERDYKSYQETHQAGATSLQVLQQAEARLKTAEATVQSAREQVAGAQKQVEGARQQLREAQEMAQKTVVLSPMDAVAIDRLAEPGDLAAPGRTLLTLQSATDLRFEASISERCARRIGDGDPVRVKIDAAGMDLDTRVQEIVPVVDPQSRSFLLRAELPALAGLQPGMFGRLSFPCGLRPVLAAPEHACFSRGQLDLVFVVQDGHARLRLVKLGRPFKGEVEVLAGLAAGEEVIVAPPENLADGDPVTATATPAPEAGT